MFTVSHPSWVWTIPMRGNALIGLREPTITFVFSAGDKPHLLQVAAGDREGSPQVLCQL